MACITSIGLLYCILHAAPETDFDLSALRDAWLRHPVYGDPSFDAFERLPNNPVVVGEAPLEWPVNGFLFNDPVSGAWYLYAGNYSEGYAVGPGKAMICTVHRSMDQGATWEALGPIFDDDAFRFEGDAHPSNYAPDMSVVYHDGRYHLVYDWLNDAAAWATLANPDSRDTDSGVGYAWSDRPEGPFIRARTPIKRTSEQPLLQGRYRRLYASTLVRRETDWLILTLTDSGPWFAWALLGMTAPTPEGPWSAYTLLLHVDQPRYLPPLLEYFPAFRHDDYLYAPATSVALNRNYQALFRAPMEQAMDPDAWENIAWGGLWHAEPRPEEHAGIWGQTFSGFVDGSGVFTVLFPSRNAANRGTLNVARRPWDRPFKERGFVLSGHGGPALGLLKQAYEAFTLQAALRCSGDVALLWNYTAPLGPDQPRSNASLHPLSLTRHQRLDLSGTTWRLISVDDQGEQQLHASGPLAEGDVHRIVLRRDGQGQTSIAVNDDETINVALPAGRGLIGVLAQAQGIADVQEFRVSGAPAPAELSYLHTEALLGAGQNLADWQTVEDEAFRYGVGALGQAADPAREPAVMAKWNVECAGFKLRAPRHPEYGQGDLYLNDTFLAALDFHGPTPERSEVRYASFPLPPGRHAVILRARNGLLPVDCLEITAPANTMATPSDTPCAGLAVAFPRDGDVLTRQDGEETDAGLRLRVVGVAPHDAAVTINGAVAERFGERFSGQVLLSERHTTLVVEGADETVALRVFYNKGSRKRYRFSVDDNIEFLKDLALAPERYPTLFDHWFLAFWREMHRDYGAKIHLNIYYQTDGFDLTEMPALWKEEWRANADWLHLSFHALQDKPDRPYRNAVYGQIAHDYDLVCEHIRRFAGDEVLGNTTTVHWAECPKPAVHALRDRGIENLVALFGTHQHAYRTSYYLSPEQSARCHFRPAWHDHDTGITFIPCAVVVNAFSPEQITQILQERSAFPQAAEIIELLIHEQYFRQELHYYQPDIMDKVRAALEWVTTNDYEPVFWSEGYLGTVEQR